MFSGEIKYMYAKCCKPSGLMLLLMEFSQTLSAHIQICQPGATGLTLILNTELNVVFFFFFWGGGGGVILGPFFVKWRKPFENQKKMADISK